MSVWDKQNVVYIHTTKYHSALKKKEGGEHKGNSLTVQCLGVHVFTAWGLGSIPGWGTKILHDTQSSQNEKQKVNIVSVCFLNNNKKGTQFQYMLYTMDEP